MNDIVAGKVRIFISSTTYDFGPIRKDLEEFISAMGYEPVLNDSPKIALPEKLDKIEGCRWLVRTSDVFVLIIGGRYGSVDKDTGKSITWIEFDTAISAKIPVYIFVDKEIFSKTGTFDKLQDMVDSGDLEEKKVKEILGGKVEDLEVFKFIKHIDTEKKGRWIHSFQNVSEIMDCLKENWSQDFKNLLVTRADGLKSFAIKDTIRPILKLDWSSDNITIDFLELKRPIKYKADTIKKMYSKAIISGQVSESLSNSSDKIKTILNNIDYHSLNFSHKFYNLTELLQLLESHNKRIKFILKIISAGKIDSILGLIDGTERSRNFGFRISNDGTAPAEEVVVYIEIPNGLTVNEEVPYSIDFFNFSEDLISILDFVKKIDLFYEVTKKIDKKLASPKTTLPDLDFLSKSLVGNPSYSSDTKIMGTLATPSPPPKNVFLEDGRIRINLSVRKLKHKFGITESSDLYILASGFDLGDEVFINYKCHADNLPYPEEGKLLVKIL